MASRSTSPSPDTQERPLLSGRTVSRIGMAVLALVLVTVALATAGRWLGQKIALGGHTQSKEEYLIEIGQDRLALAANTIRFREQRRAGKTERVDLYLAWPEMRGYAKDLKTRFDNVSRPDSLIFLQLSQSTMSRDMSGRLEPIYQRLFDGKAESASFGLTLHHLRPDSGYGREVILTSSPTGGAPYVVRCLMPGQGEPATSGDCQRDIRVGEDLTVLYRFSSLLLRDWQHIDAAVQSFVGNHLRDERLELGQAAKMPPAE